MMEEINEPFYVYLFLDPRKVGNFIYGENKEICFNNEPFYVGKGKGSRYKHHFAKSARENETNTFKLRVIKKIEKLGLVPIVIFMRTNINENDAFITEKQLIRDIGRRDLGLGPLTNLTDGGEGASGIIYSDKMKEKRRGKNNGMYGTHRFGVLNPFYGKHHTEEYKAKMSGVGNPMFGKHHTEESRQKLSDVWSKEKHPNIGLKGKDNPLFGKKMPMEFCIKVSQGLKGKPKSEEHKRNMSIVRKGTFQGNENPNHQYIYTFIDMNGNKYTTDYLSNFCDEHGLKTHTIIAYFGQHINTCKGWTFSRVKKDIGEN
jgi:hypothetical protein